MSDAALATAQQLALALRRAGIAVRLMGVHKRDKVFKYSTATRLLRVILVGDEEAASGVFGLRDGTTKQEQKGTIEELVRLLAG